MLWLLTGATTAVLVVIALFVKDISRVPTVARPAALVSHGIAPKTSGAAHRTSPPRHHRTTVTYPQVTDIASGLAYRLLASPWRQGCPADLNTPALDWTTGENTVAGHVSIGGSVIDWHGLACSGQLQQQFAYAGPADLEPTAMALVDALDPAYYAGVPHSRATEESSAMQVSGHRAWIVKFLMTYQNGASQGLTWASEPGAVVVVDRGAGQIPAVFYVSVPASLGAANLTTLIDSLRATTS